MNLNVYIVIFAMEMSKNIHGLFWLKMTQIRLELRWVRDEFFHHFFNKALQWIQNKIEILILSKILQLSQDTGLSENPFQF